MKVIVPAMAMAAIVAAPKAIICSEMRFGIRKDADMLSHTLSINLSTRIFVLSCSEIPAPRLVGAAAVGEMFAPYPERPGERSAPVGLGGRVAIDVCQRERQADGAELGEVIQSVADHRAPVLAAAENGDLALFLRNEYVFFQ